MGQGWKKTRNRTKTGVAVLRPLKAYYYAFSNFLFSVKKGRKKGKKKQHWFCRYSFQNYFVHDLCHVCNNHAKFEFKCIRTYWELQLTFKPFYQNYLLQMHTNFTVSILYIMFVHAYNHHTVWVTVLLFKNLLTIRSRSLKRLQNCQSQ